MIGTNKTSYVKHLWPITLGLLLAAGCTVDEGEEEVTSVPLTFSTSVSTLTRGTELGTDNLTSAGVFAYLTSGELNTNTATPNFMYNQKLEKSNSTWMYSPMKFWPNNDSDRISFVAYAPYVDEAVAGGSNPSFSGKTTAGYPVLTYTVPAKEADQIDLLAAAPLKNQYYSKATGNSIKLDMEHSLTKITFKVKSGDKYSKKVSALSVKTAAKGELHFKDGGFEWKNITGSNEYIPTTTTVDFAATDAGRDMATFYFLPTSAVTATFSVTYEARAANGTQIYEKVIIDKALPASPLWEAGKSIVYTINLAESTVTVTTEANSSWESTGSEEKIVKFYNANELKVGDYYYSDGTTSDGGLRQSVTTNDAAGGQTSNMLVGDVYQYEAKNPVSGKTCIGIVFYAGQGKGDKVANYSSFGMTQIDGYVVALKDCGNYMKWGPTGDINGIYNAPPTADLNFNGFANCEKVKALSNYSSYSAFYNAANYGVARPAAKASTWYLPSVAQLRSIYSSYGVRGGYTLKVVGINIGKAGGTAFNSIRYWSSTPYGPDYANYVGFVDADMYLNIPKGNSNIYTARSILTFQRVTN
ncbi:fimbrillin family protein [uncultured Bacteroides sp.]|uniref:fimbrillin family protein n=1 Tax=uncultured Bacteroides sp. TaxID=162156 RepID=UPI0025DFE1CC|nr:fimbrillin family protein [uncultured Bacteroides sp.]